MYYLGVYVHAICTFLCVSQHPIRMHLKWEKVFTLWPRTILAFKHTRGAFRWTVSLRLICAPVDGVIAAGEFMLRGILLLGYVRSQPARVERDSGASHIALYILNCCCCQILFLVFLGGDFSAHIRSQIALFITHTTPEYNYATHHHIYHSF